jgi:hypothetical protein
MLAAVIVNVALLVMFVLYLWPHRERRLQRVFIAILGALAGSLIGRMWVNPSTMGHLAFVAGGAALFCAADWARRSMRSTNSRA